MEIYCWVGAPHLISVPSKLTVQFGLFFPCYPYTGLAKPGIKPRTMRFVDECATDCNIQLKQNPFNIVDRNCPSLGLRHNREHSINNEEYWSYSAISPSFQKYSYIMKIHYIKNAVFLLHLTDVPKLEHCIYLSNNVLHRIQILKNQILSADGGTRVKVMLRYEKDSVGHAEKTMKIPQVPKLRY